MLTFNGTAGYGLQGDWSQGPLPASDLTAEAWFQPANSEPMVLLSLGSAAGDSLVVGYNSHAVFFEYTIDGVMTRVQRNQEGGARALPNNEWSHVAVSMDGTNGRVKIYVEGELYHDKIIPAATFDFSEGAGLYIGSELGQSNWLKGSIDEVRIWNAVLEHEQIRAFRHQFRSGDESGLIGLYQFDGASAGRVADGSRYGRSLSLNGFTESSFRPSTAYLPDINPAYRDAIQNAEWEVNEVQPGIVYKTHLFNNLWGGRQSLHVIEIDPEVADVRFKNSVLPAGSDYRTTSSVAREEQAVVAVNGSYWSTGWMINNNEEPWDKATERHVSVYQRVDGRDVAQTYEYHAIPNARFGLPAGSVETVDMDYGDDGAFVFNGDSTEWGIIARPQPHSGMGDNFVSGWTGFNAWDNAMSAGPLLLLDGEIVFRVDNAYTTWDRNSSWYYQMEKFPFTAAGVRADGTVVLVVGDGRQANSVGRGLNLQQIAQTLLALGCVDGLRLDGGGSATMYVEDEGVVNSPSDGGERSLPSHLLVIPKSVGEIVIPDTLTIDEPVNSAGGNHFIPFTSVTSGSIFFGTVIERSTENNWTAFGLRPAASDGTTNGGVDIGRNGAGAGFAIFDYFDHRGQGSGTARVPASPDTYRLGVGTYRIIGELDFDRNVVRAWLANNATDVLDLNRPLIEESFSTAFTSVSENYYLRLGGDGIWSQVKLRKAADSSARARAFAEMAPRSSGVLVEKGSVWKYFDLGTDPGAGWNTTGFDDSSWQSGAGELGYGDGGEATVIGFGSDSRNKYPAYFFRHTFLVGDASSVETIRLGLLRDDGAVVYLNGQELLRNNMPSGEITHTTWANDTVAGDAEQIYVEYALPAGALVDGVNTLAVSVHQDRPTSSDVSFDLWLELVSATAPSSEGILTGSVWKYFDLGTDPGASWNTLSFDDSAWQSGPGELGYGDGGEATVLGFGGNSSNKYPAYFFRHVFSITDAGQVKNLAIRLLRDDGAVLYLNGQEILRDNMPAGEITHATWASGTVDGANERTYFEYTVPATALVSGENILAVSIHQDRPSSSDISFDMELKVVMKPHPDAPVFNDDVVSAVDAIINNGYSGSLAGFVTDANGDQVFFTKISGPDWLIVNEDGTLSGTPGASNIGLNEFVIEVTDNKDGTTSAVVQIIVAEAPEIARAPLPGSDDALRFGIVPDTQGSTNGVPTAETRAVTEQLLLQKPDFAIHVGDVTDGNRIGDAKMVELNYFNQLMTTPLREAGILLYPVRGNHDAEVHRLTSDNIPVWQAAFPHLFTGSTALIDPTDVPGGSTASPNGNNYSFVFNPAPDTYLIGLDMWQGGTNSNYSNWVAEKMAEIRAENPDAHIFGYSHSGLFASANHPAMTQYIGSPSDFIAAGHANQIDGWFSGHNHIFDRSMAVDAEGRAAFFNMTVGSASNKFYTLSRSPVEGQHIGRIIDSTKIPNTPLAYQMVTINGSFVTITTYMSPKNTSGGFSDWTVWDEITYSNKGDKFTVGSGQNYSERNIVSSTPEEGAFIGTTARLVDGVNSDATAYTAGGSTFTQYRTISLGWWALEDWYADDSRQIVSDVLSIHGMRDVPNRNRADAYTLVMDFDPSLSPLHRANLSILAFLKVDEASEQPGQWVDAVMGTLGTAATEPVFRAPLADDAIGTWGIDLENNQVWARLDYQGDFAIASNVIDTDNDGLADEWEMFYFGTLEYGPNDDPDGDGLTNLQEQFLGTDPTKWDTDGDLISDGVEFQSGLDPLKPDTAITESILNAIRGNAALQSSAGLYTAESLGSLSVYPLIEIDNAGNAVLRIRVQESENLAEWENVGEELLLSVPTEGKNKQFFRVIPR